MTERPLRPYVYADTPEGPGLHGSLTEQLAVMLDGFTHRRLDKAGVRMGDRCLELGAGNGSIAHLLAGWVGDTGEVVATDLDPSQIAPARGLTIIAHDITTDPLEGSFDLIHARMLLGHLPDRNTIMHRLADTLRPGGALVVEQFDPDWDRCVIEAPIPLAEAQDLFAAYHHALMKVLREAGTDPTWGRRCPQVMRDAGLVRIEAEFWSRTWHGGQAGCQLALASATRLRDKLVAAGMAPAQLDQFAGLLADQRLMIRGITAVSVIGWRPVEVPEVPT
ncbi:MAG: class I SAM-dependent methyltransferase [Natronosporangium sp.]